MKERKRKKEKQEGNKFTLITFFAVIYLRNYSPSIALLWLINLKIVVIHSIRLMNLLALEKKIYLNLILWADQERMSS